MTRNHLISLAAAIGIVAVLAGLYFFNNRTPSAAQLPDRMAAQLTGMNTVQGRVDVTQGTVTLEQEFWSQPPTFMRAEVDKGPAGFQGTIVVLDAKETWVYVPSLGLVTVADRENAPTVDGGQAGTSYLETLAADVEAALRTSKDVQIIGEEQAAGRPALRVQLFVNPTDTPFGAGQLTVWLDKRFYYPLAVEGDNGFSLRFQFARFNQEIDPATWVFVPPPGATVRRVGGGK
jgi:outer membrane lipoprotein-sorting protein